MHQPHLQPEVGGLEHALRPSPRHCSLRRRPSSYSIAPPPPRPGSPSLRGSAPARSHPRARTDPRRATRRPRSRTRPTPSPTPAGGSTPTTIRSKPLSPSRERGWGEGAHPRLRRSVSRVHSAPSTSSQQLAVQLLRADPRPAIGRGQHLDDLLVQVDIVARPPASSSPSTAFRRSASAARIGRGVVVTSARGRGPRRSAELQIHPTPPRPAAIWRARRTRRNRCSGPRRPSALSPENSCASLPLGHLSRPRLGSQLQPPPVAPGHAEQPAHAFDHDAPRIGDRRADQRDPRARLGVGQAEDPFRPGPRLAEPAPGHHQPHAPALAAGGSWFLCAQLSKSASMLQQVARPSQSSRALRCCSSVAWRAVASRWRSYSVAHLVCRFLLVIPRSSSAAAC